MSAEPAATSMDRLAALAATKELAEATLQMAMFAQAGDIGGDSAFSADVLGNIALVLQTALHLEWRWKPEGNQQRAQANLAAAVAEFLQVHRT